MSNRDADRWNKRYTAGGLSWLESPPRKLLLEHQALLPATGYALDAAAGVVANGIFLAQRGLHVIALDISEVGLRMGQQRADSLGVSLDTAVCDLRLPWLPTAFFDVIVNFRFLIRAMFDLYRTALKPGGLLFFETYVKIQDNIRHPEHYLYPGELQVQFQDWEILHWSQTSEKSMALRPPRTSEKLVARKPLPLASGQTQPKRHYTG